jgi:hypothetical protein
VRCRRGRRSSPEVEDGGVGEAVGGEGRAAADGCAGEAIIPVGESRIRTSSGVTLRGITQQLWNSSIVCTCHVSVWVLKEYRGWETHERGGDQEGAEKGRKEHNHVPELRTVIGKDLEVGVEVLQQPRAVSEKPRESLNDERRALTRARKSRPAQAAVECPDGMDSSESLICFLSPVPTCTANQRVSARRDQKRTYRCSYRSKSTGSLERESQKGQQTTEATAK